MLSFKYNKFTNNIKIIDSYRINSKEKMLKHLKYLPIKKIGRTTKSCLNEWIAHNRLYKLGLFKEHCKDCDLSANENKFRRMCYWLLSRFYI